MDGKEELIERLKKIDAVLSSMLDLGGWPVKSPSFIFTLVRLISSVF